VRFPHNKVVPVAVFVCTVYIPFLLSEMLQLSGIVTIFFSGIAARRYCNLRTLTLTLTLILTLSLTLTLILTLHPSLNP
jgi:hypothetical protein